MPEALSVSGFVLVGGRSRRMGQDKALLPFQGRSLFQHAVELLRPHAAQVTLLGSPARYGDFGIPVLPDRRSGRGPLEALCTGLENSPCEWNIFLACDLPFLEGRFVQFLIERALASEAQAVVPRTDDGWQPLCAAYHRGCLAVMQQSPEEEPSGIAARLGRLRVQALATDELLRVGFSPRMFKNINTTEDWKEVQRELEMRAK